MYEFGVEVAFFLWLYRMVRVVVNANSRASGNLRRVGMRYSWLSGEVKELSYSDYHRTFLGKSFRFFLLILLSLPWILFSWFYVFYIVVTLLHVASKARGTPREIAELRWRLKNINLTFDEMIEWLKIASRDTRSTYELKKLVQTQMMNPIDPHRLL